MADASPSKADLIAHPVRARIILAVVGRVLTTQQIAALLPDVPRASLYRHIRQLADAGVLTVVGERRIRGTVEKAYVVRPEATLLSPEEVARTTNAEYLRLVTGFLGAMSGLYREYLADPENQLSGEIFARATPLYLTAEESERLKSGLVDLIRPLEDNKPTPERRRRIIGILGVPGQPEPTEGNDESENPQKESED